MKKGWRGEKGERLKYNLRLTNKVVIVCIIIQIALSPWIIYERAKSTVEIEEISYPWYTAIIIAPIKEEFIFRLPILGIYFAFFKKKNRNRAFLWMAVIGLGILFGTLHMVTKGGLYCLLPVIMLISLHGTLYGYLAIKTKNIIHPIIAHGSVNFLNYLL